MSEKRLFCKFSPPCVRASVKLEVIWETFYPTVARRRATDFLRSKIVKGLVGEDSFCICEA